MSKAVLISIRPEWCEFPSPCGVWVVSVSCQYDFRGLKVSVPSRGVGCFDHIERINNHYESFPSPYGVWVVSNDKEGTNQVCSISVP